MESALGSISGVLNVAAKLVEGKLGEVEVLYNPDEVTLEGLEEVILTASGERHHFKVVATTER